MRGLSVDPDERFATARDMARALEEAIPLATASRVGDWVEETAKDALDERSARIASIESASSTQAPPARISAELSSSGVFRLDHSWSPSDASGQSAPRPVGPLVATRNMVLPSSLSFFSPQQYVVLKS